MIEFSCKLRRHAFTIDVSLKVKCRTIYSLFGPSASGKSSILHAISGFEDRVEEAHLAVNDRVLVGGSGYSRRSVPAWKRRIALVEQGSLLFPNLSVGDNILYGVAGRTDDAWLNGWIERFGLMPYLSLRPDELSGGLTQRAVLARAMAVHPEVILLDEPFSALDWSLRRVLQEALLDLRRELGTTVILVTHQLAEAQRMADRMGIIRGGRILQEGTPAELMMSPATWEVAQLLGYTHLIETGDGTKFALHPSRVVPGEQPQLGPVLYGSVKQQFFHEGERRIAVELQSTHQPVVEIAIPVHTDTRPGQQFTFTVPSPPYLD